MPNGLVTRPARGGVKGWDQSLGVRCAVARDRARLRRSRRRCAAVPPYPAWRTSPRRAVARSGTRPPLTRRVTATLSPPAPPGKSITTSESGPSIGTPITRGKSAAVAAMEMQRLVRGAARRATRRCRRSAGRTVMRPTVPRTSGAGWCDDGERGRCLSGDGGGASDQRREADGRARRTRCVTRRRRPGVEATGRRPRAGAREADS